MSFSTVFTEVIFSELHFHFIYIMIIMNIMITYMVHQSKEETMLCLCFMNV